MASAPNFLTVSRHFLFTLVVALLMVNCTTYCCIRGEPAERLRYFNSVEFFDHTGLAAFRPPGVEAVLEILRRELKTIMRQAGTASIGQITNKSRFWTNGQPQLGLKR
jgi:hypothetical protein